MTTTAAANAISIDRLCWAAGIVAGASLPHWLGLPAWIPALLVACIGWRLAVSGVGWPSPPRAVRLVLAFGAFFGVLLEYRTINGVQAGSALLVVMIALKFLEAQNHRDQIVLIIIAYFLMFASLLTERSLFTAVYLFALVWITTVGLLQLGRRGPFLPWRINVRLAGRMLLHAVPLTVLLFVLFPRLPGPLWALPSNTTSATTGLSETMSPGDITELGLSDEIAFRVAFDGRAPTADKLYWRGPVLRDFNGRTWSRPPGMRRNVAQSIEYFGDRVDYRVMLEPNNRGWLFALDMPQSWSTDRGIRMGSDYQLNAFSGGPRPQRFDYNVTSHTQYSAREPLTPAEQRLYRELPAGFNPRTHALAASWLFDDPAPEQIIERALDFLRSEEFFYTLTPPALGRDSIDEFLFQTREGFCEHYASAFTFMLRAAGVPARVVTGYQGGELNGLSAYYIVRQSEAHAWTEAWLADRGWVRVDPITAVAPERVALGTSRGALGGSVLPGSLLRRVGWLSGAGVLWDAAQTYWNEWVIGYGPNMQRALLESLGFGDLRRGERWAALLGLTVAASVALLALFSLYLAWRSRRGAAHDPALRYFDRFCRRLARAAVPPPTPQEGPAAYSRRAQRTLPHAASEIDAIVAAYLRARYEPDAECAALDELKRRVTQFRLAHA